MLWTCVIHCFRLIQSEYDEYREKYRLFDSALFCMPPENKFRKTVKAFLTYQCADPDSSQLKRGKGWSFELIKSRLSYGIRLENRNTTCTFLLLSYFNSLYTCSYFVSRLPYFGWAMLFITLATIGALMYEVYTDDATKKNPTYLWVIDLIFVLSTLTELILKVRSQSDAITIWPVSRIIMSIFPIIAHLHYVYCRY